MDMLEHRRKLLSMVGWLWVAAIGLLLLAIFFPALGRRYQESRGLACNEKLEILFRAKQELVRDLNLDPTRPYPKVVQLLTLRDLAPYLKRLGGENLNWEEECPAGGDYTLRPLVDESGEVIPPVCGLWKADPDGNGQDMASEGLHVHLRSYLRDPDTGAFIRDPGVTFPKELGKAGG
ncbi:MAG: hypothetical protein GHCLOJNM_01313 [bacterium]|nr:hypothetical protein [bacterium]